MVTHRPMWVDFGMATAVAVFAALVLFARSADYFELLMVIYAFVLVVWAFIAEVALVRTERASAIQPRHQPASRPLPH